MNAGLLLMPGPLSWLKKRNVGDTPPAFADSVCIVVWLLHTAMPAKPFVIGVAPPPIVMYSFVHALDVRKLLEAREYPALLRILRNT